MKAALSVSPVTGVSTPRGELPDNIASWTARGARTVVLHLRHAVNPSWFTPTSCRTSGGGVYPLPSQDWNVDSAQGEHITDWATNPADALKIYHYLQTQGTDQAAFATNPLWKVVDGPFKLKVLRRTNGPTSWSRTRPTASGPRLT